MAEKVVCHLNYRQEKATIIFYYNKSTIIIAAKYIPTKYHVVRKAERNEARSLHFRGPTC